MNKKMTWLQAIVEVMGENDGKMTAHEIAQQVIDKDLKGVTPTPFATVGACIYSSIKRFGDDSPFKLVAPATFIFIKEKWTAKTNKEPTSKEIEESIDKHNIIKAFGMFWDRNKVDWDSSDLKLLGQSSMVDSKNVLKSSKPINFAKQTGIYVLYDHRTVVYVGRAIKGSGSIGKRLKDHTKDRLNTRWNRFSWFGTFSVKEDSKLSSNASEESYSLDKIISTIEAILIESMEPLQNRRAGDDFGFEFVQLEDNSKKEGLLKELLKKA